MPNLSATPGRYQAGSTANFVTASSPESFLQILPSGTLRSQLSVTVSYRIGSCESVACVALAATIKGQSGNTHSLPLRTLSSSSGSYHFISTGPSPIFETHAFTFMCAFVMAMVGRISTAPHQDVCHENGAGPTYRPPLRPGP